MYSQFTVHVNYGGDHEFLQVILTVWFACLCNFKLDLAVLYADTEHVRKHSAAFQDEHNRSLEVEALLHPVIFSESDSVHPLHPNARNIVKHSCRSNMAARISSWISKLLDNLHVSEPLAFARPFQTFALFVEYSVI